MEFRFEFFKHGIDLIFVRIASGFFFFNQEKGDPENTPIKKVEHLESLDFY